MILAQNETTTQFLAHLRQLGVRVWRDEEGRLRYKAPKGVMTKKLMAGLKGHKDGILAMLEAADREKNSAGLGVQKANRSEAIPLSVAQQRLWFLEQLHGSSPAYNISGAFRLRGALDVAALRRSLAEIVRRYESLRTVFRTEPIQLIQEGIELGLDVEDLRGFAGEAQGDAVRAVVNEEASRPFDITTDVLMRTRLLQTAQTEHILLVTFHHLVVDGRSLEIFNGELAALYTAFAAGRPSPLAEPSYQYADFAASQRAWLDSEQMAGQLAYWEKQLVQAPDLLTLPLDRSRPAMQSFNGALVRGEFTADLVGNLRQLAQQEGASLYMVVQAAFSAFLGRYSNQNDVLTGLSAANRHHAGLENLIGFFVNNLVIRVDVNGERSFRELLRQVRGTALDAFANQDVPFEKLVEMIRPERDMSYAPLVQVLLNWLDGSQGQPDLEGLTIEPIFGDFVPARVDLALEVYEYTDRLELMWLYNTDLFAAATMERWAKNFGAFVAGLAADPDCAVGELPLMTADETSLILETFNRPVEASEETDNFVAQFEAQVAQTPEKTALICGDEVLSYAELNLRANRLGAALVDAGIGRDCRVGVCLKRSADLVVALLGILKAGGAYVPLDPDFPADRLAYILADSQAKIILTQADVAPILPTETGAEIWALDQLGSSLLAYEDSDLKGMSRAEDLAYVIHTSGSTGRPKGVMVTRGNLVSFSENLTQTWGLTAEDSILALTTVTFDIAGLELLSSLLVGMTVVVADDRATKEPREIFGLLHEHGITALQATPSRLQLLLAGGRVDELSGLRTLLVGGEALPPALFEQLEPLMRTTSIFNVYGPTEATIWSTSKGLGKGKREKEKGEREITIGRPLLNEQVLILDDAGELCPVGVVGEICIGGEGVAKGYWGREELTAERFVEGKREKAKGKNGGYGSLVETQSQESKIENRKSRIYRTGDLGYWLPDGELICLGRSDFQVKVRGFRVELGEIEAALMGHPLVSGATVVLRDDLGVGPQLVAYVIGEGMIDLGMVRPELVQVLPEYMIPSYLVQLEVFPLTFNGKIDRKRLPEPVVVSTAEATGGRSPLEDGLAEIWADVLQVAQVGVNDDFFDLGGHSLLAMQVITRIEATYGCLLPVRAIFEGSTVARLAKRIGEVLQGDRPLLPAIGTAAREGILPLSYAQQRLWILSQMEGQEATYNIALALRVEGNLDVLSLQTAVDTLVARHETLRTGFEAVEGQARQVIYDDVTVEVEIVDGTFWDTDRVKTRIGEEGKRPFDLGRPPLLRLTLVRLGTQEAILQVTMHHIVTDGWSLTVLVRELAELYEGFVAQRPVELPALAVQYADYAAWQHEHLGDEALAPQIEYWTEQLGGLPPLLNLPTDRPRPVVQTSNGRIAYFEFDAELTAGLKRVAREHHVTLFMTLLAGFGALLSRYSNQDDIPVGSGIANRTRPELESLIGFFVNTLVMRVDMAGNPSFAALLARVREMTLGAYAHQDVPFERLVEILQPTRNTSHAPLFQVIFTLQNMPAAEAHLPELDIAPWQVEESTAKYDITVLMTEEGDKLTGTLEYNTDLFDGETIERLLEHFQILLRGGIAEPERPLLAHPILTEQEVLLLEKWNETAAGYPENGTILSLFQDMVARYGERMAVTAGDAQLTYGELDHLARKIGSGLVARGVRAGDRVGLLLPRNETMVAGILGVLYAGGVYLPLDPEYPSDRLGHMVGDSGCRVVVKGEIKKEKGERGSLAWCDEVAEIVDYGVLVQAKGEPLQAVIDPDAPAYLLYTSGSTGKPKGVLVTHRNVVRLMHNSRHPFDFDERDVWVVAHSFCFDFSVWEMYGALLYGGRVVIAKRDTVRDTGAFLTLIGRERVTVLNQTPPAFYNLVAHEALSGGGTLGGHLRTVIFGGDRLDPTYLRPWVEKYPLDLVRLVNMYGITETTVHVTHYTLTDDDVWGAAGRSPIGVPIPETTVHILNEAGERQPIGVAGEIYVGGSGVSAGYWGREDLTGERFVKGKREKEKGKNGFGLGVGTWDGGSSLVTRHSVLYRSGDMGRWLADGTLEHMGRNDFQVQLRGFRIELGEIEQVILGDEGVAKGVVIARGENEDKRLLAYLIPADGDLARYAQMQVEGAFEGEKVTALPDGRMMVHLNQSETEFIYDEIFTHNSYLQHGVTVNDGDVVFDVGANIGMFSLLAGQAAEGVKVFAFEPLPAAAGCLRLNGRLHDLDLTVFEKGISDEAGTTSFNYYPHASVLSGQHAGTEDERETVRAFLKEKGKREKEKGNGDDLLEELLDERLKVEVITAELVTLSEAIAASGVERIDLLKIDVEKGERAVLNGIETADWGKIQQVVMEVHDIDGALAWVEGVLGRYGFVVAVDQDQALVGSDMYNVYGFREERREKREERGRGYGLSDSAQEENLKSKIENRKSVDGLLDRVRARVAENLPEYMMPSGFVLLGELPLTRNGKIDRRALPEPELRQDGVTLVEARNETERLLVGVWQEVLNVAEIGVFDDFFALGGHSLLATQLVARIPAVFGVELPLSHVFETPTVAALAEQIDTLQWAAGAQTDGLTNTGMGLEQGKL